MFVLVTQLFDNNVAQNVTFVLLTFYSENAVSGHWPIGVSGNAGEPPGILGENLDNGQSVEHLSAGDLVVRAVLDDRILSVPLHDRFRLTSHSHLKHDLLTLSGS